MLEKLKRLKESGEQLIITPAEYQELCLEVFNLGLPEASNYDDLILNYVFEGKQVVVIEVNE